jgi:hypothetical protein
LNFSKLRRVEVRDSRTLATDFAIIPPRLKLTFNFNKSNSFSRRNIGFPHQVSFLKITEEIIGMDFPINHFSLRSLILKMGSLLE